MKRLAVTLLLSLLAAGCAPKFRSFDGTLGFRSDRQDDGSLVVSYTDEARYDAAQLTRHIENGCALALGREPGQVVVSGTHEEVADTRMSFTVPIAALVYAESTSIDPSGKAVGRTEYQTFHEPVSVALKTRTLHGTCRLASAAP